jgi:hypothetical protein
MASKPEEDDQSRKIYLKRGLGPAPENPVCDSGIFCYGKKNYIYWLLRYAPCFHGKKSQKNFPPKKNYPNKIPKKIPKK